MVDLQADNHDLIFSGSTSELAPTIQPMTDSQRRPGHYRHTTVEATQQTSVKLWQRAEQLFLQLINLDSAERQPIFQQLAIEQPDLLVAVKRLLAFDQQTSHFQQSIRQVAASLCSVQDNQLQPGQRIDGYQILRLIGQGGSSLVYLAERVDAQFQQQVAIKLLQNKMMDTALLQAFKAERQILANLEHTAISRLIDGGSTTQGLPYLVMEYVPGLPIDQYCQEQALSITGRLQLMVKVSNAVAYAHQNMVVHCDLSPANILVTTAGEPKLVDFGIARLQNCSGIEGVPAADTLRNEVEYPQRLTRHYASPEQLNGQSLSTLTDVYSLGMVLYQLLLGQRPSVSGDTAQSIKQQKAEKTDNLLWTDPTASNFTPTQFAKAVPVSVATAGWRRLQARLCHTELPRFYQLPTDLQWILRKATAQQPAKRYPTVVALADDLKRYLGKRMVHARPYSLFYQTMVLVRRNTVSSSISIAFIFVFMLIGGMLWQQNSLLTAERDSALKQLADVYQQAESSQFSVPWCVPQTAGENHYEVAMLARILPQAVIDEVIWLQHKLPWQCQPLHPSPLLR